MLAALGEGPTPLPVLAHGLERHRDAATRSFRTLRPGRLARTTTARPGGHAAVAGKWSGCEDPTLEPDEGQHVQGAGVDTLRASAQMKRPSPIA